MFFCGAKVERKLKEERGKRKEERGKRKLKYWLNFVRNFLSCGYSIFFLN